MRHQMCDDETEILQDPMGYIKIKNDAVATEIYIPTGYEKIVTNVT